MESIVDVVNSVRGKEEYALVVFQHSKEDGDEFVAVEVLGAAGFHEYVGFVYQ